MSEKDLTFSIAKLKLSFGDILVVKGPKQPNHSVIRQVVPVGVRILYIPPEVELSVLTKAEIDARAEDAA